MAITISEVSKKWGITRATIYKKINQGKLSRLSDRLIDVAEVVRVFGEPSVSKKIKDTVSIGGYTQGENAALLQEKIRNLEDTVRQSKDREREAREREDWLRGQVEKLTETIGLLEDKTPRKKGLLSRLFGD
jgi:predicted transcriptional regulator